VITPPRPYAEYAVEVVTRSGRVIPIGFRMRSDLVEIMHAGRQLAVFDRDLLRGWLENPGDPVERDEITFTVDYSLDWAGGIAIVLKNESPWALSAADSMWLRRYV